MNNMEKAPMDIGAGWFIVRHDFRKSLMVTIIPPAVGVTLSIAALLKVIEFIHHPDRQRVSWFDLASIGSELFLGLWLISGALPEAARRVAIGCFSVFACYTFYEALAGKTDCGCFGQVKVNPWFTVVLDVAVVLALVFLAKPAANLLWLQAVGQAENGPLWQRWELAWPPGSRRRCCAPNWRLQPTDWRRRTAESW